MTLDWHFTYMGCPNGCWDFSGTYQVNRQGSADSLGGDIAERVVEPSTALYAQMTVTVATGQWNGFSGTRTWKGRAQGGILHRPRPTGATGQLVWNLRG